MREPAFWWHDAGIACRLLVPLAAVYDVIASRRLLRAGERAAVPVICVGNLTVGGAGKTPAVIAIARLLAQAGAAPFLLSRGYGGACPGPLRVDPGRHASSEVGDEPLLLARMAATIVARDRVKGAAAAAAAGASVIVMDDGFQNPSLTKDCSVLVLDARRGIGNGRMIPAGPLRAPLAAQLGRADALVVVGPGDRADAIAAKAQRHGQPVFHARIVPDVEAVAALAPVPVLAFAGIGDPRKLFASLSDAGVKVAVTRGFPDHHRYSQADARTLCAEAERSGLTLVTTEKDLARMQGDAGLADLAARVRVLPVRLALADPDAVMDLLRRTIAPRAQAGKAGRRSALEPLRVMALQHGLGRRIGLLPIDAPVFQLFERDRRAGHRASHECAGPHHAKIAIEISDLGLAGHWRRTIESIQHIRLRHLTRITLSGAAWRRPQPKRGNIIVLSPT